MCSWHVHSEKLRKIYCPVIEGDSHSTSQVHPSSPRGATVTNIIGVQQQSLAALQQCKTVAKSYVKEQKRHPEIHDLWPIIECLVMLH